MEHSQRILKIIAEKGFTEYRVSKETGISNSLFGKWKAHPTSKISSCNLVLIADYLGCSVDFLLGRTENPEINR
ncbi:MAG: helix-turn-helix transcriptional regulator [Oscillibacter sp.]|nr:helix-turn-helix transcriptional regulator [Oscillibacter sp.]MBD5169901.1 helix-turn-helix transcriptional regulator [Oscillibacter sp.]